MALSTRTVTIKTLSRSSVRTKGRERVAQPKSTGYTTRTVSALVKMLTNEELVQQPGGDAPVSIGYLLIENTAANLAALGLANLSACETLKGAHITNIGYDVSYFVTEARPVAQKSTDWLYLRLEFSDNSPAR